MENVNVRKVGIIAASVVALITLLSTVGQIVETNTEGVLSSKTSLS